MNNTPEQIYEALKKPFAPHLLHWRVGARTKDKTKGIALAYLNARDVMKRLDDVVGMENWQCRYPYAGCCELSVRINGEWITKSDGAGETDVEGRKGQYSDSLKRAAVLFGVGRYLYYLDSNDFWRELNSFGSGFKLKGKQLNNSLNASLPQWAKPEPNVSEDEIKKFQELVERFDLIGFWSFYKDLSVDAKIDLANSFADKRSGQSGLGKTEGKELVRKLEKESPAFCDKYLFDITSLAENRDRDGLLEVLGELSEEEQKLIIAMAPQVMQYKIESVLEEV